MHCRSFPLFYFAVNVETDEINLAAIAQRTVDIFYEVFSNIYKYISFSTLVNVCFVVFMKLVAVLWQEHSSQDEQKCVLADSLFFLM